MTTTTSHTMKRTTEASAPTLSVSGDPSPLSEVKFGVVHAYSVNADRLMIKFGVIPFFAGGETQRILLSVAADAPHFRSAVSMVMMVVHTDQGPKYLTVRYSLPNPIPGVPAPSPEVLQALEIGYGGTDPNSALSFDDWPT
jgi:hypothetical protein